MRTLIVTGHYRYGKAEIFRHTVAASESDIFHFAVIEFGLGARNATTIARALWSGKRASVDDFGWTEIAAREVIATPETVRRVIPNGLERRRNVGETAEAMRACMLDYAVRGAESLQWAEDTGHTFDWSDCWEIRSHVDEFDGYDREPETCEVCTMYDTDGNVIASLGCIDDADDAYRQTVEIELAWEAMPESVQLALPLDMRA